jgi:hypothetical protein
MKEETRIYAVVAATIQTSQHVIQPPGRQIAQVAHAVSKLRHCHLRDIKGFMGKFEPMTTIVLACRDSAELIHVYQLAQRAKLKTAVFADQNLPAYGSLGWYHTAVAYYATKSQHEKALLNYLKLWS